MISERKGKQEKRSKCNEKQTEYLHPFGGVIADEREISHVWWDIEGTLINGFQEIREQHQSASFPAHRHPCRTERMLVLVCGCK